MLAIAIGANDPTKPNALKGIGGMLSGLIM